MKPKRRVMCPDCMRQKMLFETERKAQDFIRWNGDSMEYGGDTLRAYYCPSCCGWHISHHGHRDSYDRQTDQLIDAYRRRTKRGGAKHIDKLLTSDGQQLARQAREVYEGAPDECRASEYKTGIRDYMKRYILENGIDDAGGVLRHEVYLLWESDRKQRIRSNGHIQ